MADLDLPRFVGAMCADADPDAARRCYVFKPEYGVRPDNFVNGGMMKTVGVQDGPKQLSSPDKKPMEKKPMTSQRPQQVMQKQPQVYMPRHRPGHSAFRFKQTSIFFDSENTTIQELTNAILEWAENE